jgi:DNA anti-recombination protein RmuC
MWKRSLACAIFFLLSSVQQPSALASDLRQLDTKDLLKEAALAIKHLQALNETLTQQAAASEKQSKRLAAQLETLTRENEKLLKDIEDLQAALGTLQADWSESERMRKALEHTLTSLQASLQSCREEAKRGIRRAGIIGLAVGVGVGMMVGVIITR